MIKHYIKVAFRNLAQQKVLSGINVFGLSVGIACFSLFLLYAVHEFSYDRFLANSDRIYRIVEWWQGEKREPGGYAWAYTPVAPAMKRDFPDVEHAVRLKGSECFVRADNKVFHTSITFADTAFFQVFTFPLIYGNTEALVQNILGTTPEKAIGMQLLNAIGDRGIKTIIGVARNFNFEDLTHKVRPQLFYRPANFKPTRIFVRLEAGDPGSKLTMLNNAWKKLVPDAPFEYSFVDEKFDNFYKNETRWSSIAGWAGGISIFLACLGLFGLAALAAVNRTKEIGIRKVMGATVTQIAGLLSKDFVKLITVALVIATPLAWYVMHNWLQAYAWRINIAWWAFALTGAFAILVAVTTVSVQAIKAAMTNPVKTLRNE